MDHNTRDDIIDLIEEIEVREEMKGLPSMCSCFSFGG